MNTGTIQNVWALC